MNAYFGLVKSVRIQLSFNSFSYLDKDFNVMHTY